MFRGRIAALGVISLLFCSQAAADSLVDNLNPRSIGMGETMRGSAHAGLSTSLNPSGLALSRQLVFEGSFGYRPQDGATGVAASACDATVPLPGCFYYQYFGASPEVAGSEERRRVHETGTLFARQLSDILFAGINIKYFDYRSDLPDEEDASGFGLDLGVSMRAGDHVELGVVGYNVVGADAAQYPRAVGSGIALRPADPLSIGLDGVWSFDLDDDETPGRYGLGAEYFFSSADRQSGVPVRLGGVYDVPGSGAYVTAGGGYMTRSAGVDVGARYQVSGGDELMMLASVRILGPAMH